MIEGNTTKKHLLHEIETLRQQIEELQGQHRVVERTPEQSEDRYKRLIRLLTDYIYHVTVEDGRVVDTYHGPGCVAVTGYTSEDFDGDSELWFRMVNSDDRERVTKQAQQALRGEFAEPIEHRIMHRDGSERWIRNTIALRKDDAGRLLSYDGLISDITQRKRAEKDAQVNQQRLIQADKMSSLGILASSIAHEINNPINFIQLNAQLWCRVWKDITPILKEYYETHGEFFIAGMPYSQEGETFSQSISGTLDGIDRIKKIIDNLKAFARRDPGDLNQEVEINSVVEAAVVLLDNLIRQSSRRFQIAYGTHLPTINGNFQQLEQVVVNLLTNACQALDHPGKGMKLTTGLDVDANNVVITVSDQGVGIPEENMKIILDPFFTTKRDREGTGLGLSITNQIIQNHGGRLIYSSEVGKGTTFTVSLPAMRPS
ncbi:MAG TPA: ATP-binding protein [bacterium]